jgi:hypothetical protein
MYLTTEKVRHINMIKVVKMIMGYYYTLQLDAIQGYSCIISGP